MLLLGQLALLLVLARGRLIDSLQGPWGRRSDSAIDTVKTPLLGAVASAEAREELEDCSCIWVVRLARKSKRAEEIGDEEKGNLS